MEQEGTIRFQTENMCGFMLDQEHPLIDLIPLLVIIGLKLLVRFPVTLRKIVSQEERISFRSPALEGYMGMQRTAATDLRLEGKGSL